MANSSIAAAGKPLTILVLLVASRLLRFLKVLWKMSTAQLPRRERPLMMGVGLAWLMVHVLLPWRSWRHSWRHKSGNWPSLSLKIPANRLNWRVIVIFLLPSTTFISLPALLVIFQV